MSAFIDVAGPGAWNDPDQLLVGNTPCPQTNFTHNPRWMKCTSYTRDEERSQLAIWSIIAAPLLISVDIEKMPDASKADLLNPEILAVNSDALGRQGHRITNESGQQVWLRKLQNGDVAVALHNSADVTQRVGTPISGLALSGSGRWTPRDLFARKSLHPVESTGSLDFTIPPHGVVMLRLTPEDDYKE